LEGLNLSPDLRFEARDKTAKVKWWWKADDAVGKGFKLSLLSFDSGGLAKFA
jgi:hypothetical protein